MLVLFFQALQQTRGAHCYEDGKKTSKNIITRNCDPTWERHLKVREERNAYLVCRSSSRTYAGYINPYNNFLYSTASLHHHKQSLSLHGNKKKKRNILMSPVAEDTQMLKSESSDFLRECLKINCLDFPASLMSFPTDTHHPPATSYHHGTTTLPLPPTHCLSSATDPHAPHAPPHYLPHAPPVLSNQQSHNVNTTPSPSAHHPPTDFSKFLLLQRNLAEQNHHLLQVISSMVNNNPGHPPQTFNTPMVQPLNSTTAQSLTVMAPLATNTTEKVELGEAIVQDYVRKAHADSIDAQLIEVLNQHTSSTNKLDKPVNLATESSNPQPSVPVAMAEAEVIFVEDDDSTLPPKNKPTSLSTHINPNNPRLLDKNAISSSLLPVAQTNFASSSGVTGLVEEEFEKILAPKPNTTSTPTVSCTNQVGIPCTIPNATTPIFSAAETVTTANPVTKPSYANFLRPKTAAPVIPFSQLPAPYKKGHLMAVKLDENIYQRSLLQCQHNLHGKLILKRGKNPIKAVDLHLLLSNVWNTKDSWSITPIGRGFYTLRFSNEDDK
ncbi:hypothetical protein LguiA_003066 [Lonicera macranthoides]